MTATTLPANSPEPRPTLSVSEAAELLGVSRWLVLQQIQQGNLPHKRFGRRILISRARFLNWLDEQPTSSDETDPNFEHAAVPLDGDARAVDLSRAAGDERCWSL